MIEKGRKGRNLRRLSDFKDFYFKQIRSHYSRVIRTLLFSKVSGHSE